MKIYIVQWYEEKDPIKIFFNEKEAIEFFNNIIHKQFPRDYYIEGYGWQYGKILNTNMRARVMEFNGISLKTTLLYGWNTETEKENFDIINKSLRRKLCNMY